MALLSPPRPLRALRNGSTARTQTFSTAKILSTPRVIFVNRVYWPNESATAQLLTDLAEALAAHGWAVHVVCSGPQTELRHRGVTIHRSGHAADHRSFANRAFGYLHFLRAARRTVAQLARRGDIVVLKTDPPLLAAATTALAVRRGARVVQWIQDIYPEIALQHGGAWMRPLLAPLRIARDRAWRAATLCVAVGGDMRRHVVHHGVPEQRVWEMPNWAPREMESPPLTDAVAARREAWGWNGKFVVAYSGNLGRVHEFDTLLGAAQQLAHERKVHFAFIGGGARWSDVASQVAARKLTNVQLEPAQPRAELAASLGAADAHVVTLLPGFENLVQPSKVSGALAAGRPVLFVGPPTSALAQFLARHDCGVTVAPGDSGGVATILKNWLRNPSAVQRLGANARRAYETALRFALAIERWEQLLRVAAAGSDLPTEAATG